MADRAPSSTEVQSLRIGRTDLGPATVGVDDEGLRVVVRGSDVRPMRVRWADVEAVDLANDELTLALSKGTRVTMASASAFQLRDDIVARCQLLPELTSALRALGSRRGQRGARDDAAEQQTRFFKPLLEARRRAATADSPAESIGAFDADTIVRMIDATLRAFANERFVDDAPARRALEAELLDLADPLRGAFDRLRRSAAGSASAPGDLPLWRAWAAQLRVTFEIADGVWLSLDAALDAERWAS